MILIFISFENKIHAEKVANYLIDNRLVACVSLIPVKSYYYWKGKKTAPNEIEAIVKTRKENFAKIEKVLHELLEYEIPQLIVIEARRVNKDYLQWMEEGTK